MRGRDKKRKVKRSVDDAKLMKRNVKEFTDGVKQMVAERIAEEFAEDPTRFARLVEVGLVDEATLQKLPDDLDFAAVVKQFRERLSAMAADQPSVLKRLEVRPLDVLSETEPSDPDPLPRTRLAVVFSDLEGFTGYTSTRGDLEASALLRDHYEAVDSVVRGRGGSVMKTIGDGHMLSFTQSRAAVLAAVELAESSAGPLRIRVGGHNGDVVKTADDLFGHVVNVAARITDIADGGQSLVTTSMRDAAGVLSNVAFEAPEPTQLRGIQDPYDVCRVHPI